MIAIKNADEAQRALLANLPPRFFRLDKLERYVDGTQYDDRPSFWDDAKPLFERAPCIVYSVVESAIRSNVDLCLGDKRWPAITSLGDEDDSTFDERFGLDEADSEIVDRFVKAIEEQSRLRSRGRELLTEAQACSTAVAILGIRSGRLCIDVTKAKWCTPTFDVDHPEIVSELEIRYPYLEQYRDDVTGEWSARCMLYRRVIDAERDVAYRPAKASVDGKEPSWIEDRALDHAFGFCPVHWYKFMPRCSTVAEIDGQAIHVHLLDEIDALNFALSMRHRAALYAGDPQIIETGVRDGEGPSADGRSAMVIPNTDDVARGYTGPGWLRQGGVNRTPARKRGPGHVWTYESEQAKVEMLTLPGDALTPSADNINDLRAKIAESLAVVFTDPSNQKQAADISGRALREHHKRQLERCDQIRDDFGTNCLLPIVDMLLRIALAKGDGLYIAGVKQAAPILERFLAAVEGNDAERWFSPALKLDWGEYFTLSGADKKADIEAVQAAHDAGFITQRTAVEEMRDYFNIGSLDEYMEALDKEEQESSASLLHAQNILNGNAQADQEDGDPAQSPSGAPSKPTPNAGDGKSAANKAPPPGKAKSKVGAGNNFARGSNRPGA